MVSQFMAGLLWSLDRTLEGAARKCGNGGGSMCHRSATGVPQHEMEQGVIKVRGGRGLHHAKWYSESKSWVRVGWDTRLWDGAHHTTHWGRGDTGQDERCS